MQPGLVSILMPAYNGAEFIRQAVDSVIVQSYPQWELVVVDDGSTDQTAAIIAGYPDARIRYAFQENRGQAAALNRGLALAEGEFITTLDVDDWLAVDSLADRVAYLAHHLEDGAVYGNGFYCDVAGRPLMRFSENRVGDVAGDVYATLIYTPFFGTGANVMVRRQVLDQHQIQYDESIVWCQDYDFYIRIAAVARFGLVHTPTVWYRLHAANMTMAMTKTRQLRSLLATRLKVLRSPRFAELTAAEQGQFFNVLLSQDAGDREADQAGVVDSAAFRSLPPAVQAKILLQAAQVHLLQQRLGPARRLLRRAWVRHPFGPRTAAALALAHLSPSLARAAILRWRRLRGMPTGPVVSPLEAAKLA